MAHGGHNCSHAHDHDESPEMGIQYSLYEKIDFENLTCLNESIENSGRGIFKSWEERLNFDKVFLLMLKYNKFKYRKSKWVQLTTRACFYLHM